MGIGIGKVSKLTGCTIETIRYYERIDMVQDPGRGQGGHRVYGDNQVKQLRFIKRARELGFSLDDIRELLALSGGTVEGCSSAQSITEQHLVQVKEKLADLSRLEIVLTNLTSLCSEQQNSCSILEALAEE
jgi:MerR family mercuric resistance operon transcriptional regulator